MLVSVFMPLTIFYPLPSNHSDENEELIFEYTINVCLREVCGTLIECGPSKDAEHGPSTKVTPNN